MLDEVIKILEEKLQKLDEYKQISSTQLDILKSGQDTAEDLDYDVLAECVDKKDELIVYINNLDNTFVEKFESIKNAVDGGIDEVSSLPEFSELQQKIKDVFSIVKDLSDQDKIISEMMKNRFEFIKKEIKSVNDFEAKSRYLEERHEDLDKGFFLDEKK